ncbi:VWA domain-containing protein [Rossellomorea vietnamensis]|nr:VWA domain-containing protein [Rossellomorea vietnamensis]
MRNFRVTLILLIGVFLLMTGCGKEEKEEKEEQQSIKQAVSNNSESSDKGSVEPKGKREEKSMKITPLPDTYKELENLPVGKDSSYIPTATKEEKMQAIELFKDLPNIKENPSQKELDNYYQELLQRVQKDFKGPETLFKQLRFQSFGNPDIEDLRYQFKDNLNVEIILDSSGSMAQNAGNNTKMDAAKEEIMEFIRELPEGTKVGLRVYGHKGSNADKDKTLSCSSSDVLYPIEPFVESKFESALKDVQPTGWTPISLALNEARQDLMKYDGESNTNIVYLISDGIETCDEDPISAANKLYKSNINPIINVIGFNVNGEGQRQLKEIADSTEGIYQNVEDQDGLKSELNKINDVANSWKEWKEKGEQSIDLKEVQNGLEIFNYITEEESKSLNEKDQINLLVYTFQQNSLMSKESRIYLEEKNNKYHEWIDFEIEKFNSELKNINQQNYQQAKKILEHKYQINTQ